MAHQIGRVNWFNNMKGYGFLTAEGQPDVFVHYSGINRDGYKTLKEGQTVEFDTEAGPTGRLQATNVTLRPAH